MNTIGFLGTGNMGTAILKGIAGSSMKSETKLYAYNPTAAKVDALASYGVQKCSSEAEVAAASQYLFLAIKPQKFDEVLPRIADAITEDTVLVSIAAGIGVEYIRKLTKPNAKVVLAMPNTPLLLGEGATALCRTSNVPEEDFARVRSAFSCCGVTQEIDEAQMNAVIAVSGSSPAYLYLLAKLTCDYAAQQGIDPKTALTLFCQTMKGSADMLLNSGKDPQALIDMVTSKGGTTFALLNVLKEQGFNEAMINSFEACTHRAEELSM